MKRAQQEAKRVSLTLVWLAKEAVFTIACHVYAWYLIIRGITTGKWDYLD